MFSPRVDRLTAADKRQVSRSHWNGQLGLQGWTQLRFVLLPLLLFRTLLHWQQGNREGQRGCKRKLATHILNPTPFIDQVCSGCTQRAAISETIRTKTEMFQRTATSNVEEAPKSKTTQNAPKVSSWSYDMTGHADQCADIYCELANKSVSQLKQAATICIDDHELNRNMLKSLVNRLRFAHRSY